MPLDWHLVDGCLLLCIMYNEADVCCRTCLGLGVWWTDVCCYVECMTDGYFVAGCALG